MKAKPYKLIGDSYHPCEASEATHVELHTPGPFTRRIMPVILKGSRHGTNCWSWNGDTERPTLKPSILTWTDDHRCHTWINDGQVIFLPDCSHEFAGKTMDLLEVDP